MYDICMLRHNKSVISMTFVCLGIAKLECQISFGISFSLSNKPMYDILKRKICKEKSKAKRLKMLLKMIACIYSRRCGSYKLYLKGDSPHQAVMIVCELKRLSHISNHHKMYTLMQSCDVFHTQHAIFFATLYTCADTIWFGHHKFYMC